MKSSGTNIFMFILLVVTNSLFCSSEKKLTPTQALLKNVKTAASVAYEYTAPVVVATGAFIQNTAIPGVQSYLKQNPTSAPVLYQDHLKKSDSDSDASSDTSSNSEMDTGYEFVESCDKKTKKKNFFSCQEELDRSINNNPHETIHRINNTMNSYFRDGSIESRITQKQIAHLIALLEASEKKIALQPIIADQYNQQQLDILKKNVTDHATRILPRIQEEHATTIMQLEQDRDRKIETAHKKFADKKEVADKKHEQEIGKSLQKIRTIATNSVYLNLCAQSTKEDHPLHNLTIFETQEKYTKALADLRPTESQEPLKNKPRKDKKKP